MGGGAQAVDELITLREFEEVWAGRWQEKGQIRAQSS